MDANVKKALTELFTTEELGQIEAFLDRGFNSLDAQVAIASIFMYAKENGKSVAEVLVECEKEWKRNWNYQHPDIKGGALASGGAGRQNIASLANIYKMLGIPLPAETNKDMIPVGEFAVKTRNSTYQFGKDEGDGIRSVSTDSHLQLLRNQCKITTLAVGESMEFDYYPEYPDGRHCVTSAVVSIEEPGGSPKEASINAGL